MNVVTTGEPADGREPELEVRATAHEVSDRGKLKF